MDWDRLQLLAATKVRWCWLVHEYGTFSLSPLASNVLVLCVVTGITQSGVALPVPVPFGIILATRRPCGVPSSKWDLPSWTVMMDFTLVGVVQREGVGQHYI